MISLWQRYVRAHPRAVDVSMTLVSVFISFPGVTVSVDGAPLPSGLWPGYLLTGIACAAMAWLRSYPRAIAVVAIACATALAALGYTLSPLLLAPTMVALFFVALRASQKTAFLFTVAAIAILVGTALITGPAGRPIGMETIGTPAWLLLPLPLAIVARLRAAYLEAANARAEYAERTREEEARHRVADERMRIARELHDVVAHHLALANAQASTAAHLMRTDPDKARSLVTDLTGTTSSALRELKATVGLLRQAGDPETPLEPAPGLARLEDLTASFGAAGLAVTVTADGEPQQPSPVVDLTAFRIISEALTNVTKHAAGSAAQVRLGYAPGCLTITITNDSGTPAPESAASGPGYGIIGMRERALSIGGRLDAGRCPGGGFKVTAELPLQPRSRAEAQTP
jgi:signal transduction histidine kinase